MSNARKLNRGCILGQWFRELKPVDQVGLRKAMRDAAISANAIYDVISELGYSGKTPTIVNYHRREKKCLNCSADPKGIYAK